MIDSYATRLLDCVFRNETTSDVLEVVAEEFSNPCCLLNLTNPMLVARSHRVETDDAPWNQTVYEERPISAFDYDGSREIVSTYWSQDFAMALTSPVIVDNPPHHRGLCAAFKHAGTMYCLVVLENDVRFTEESFDLVGPALKALALTLRQHATGGPGEQLFSSLLNKAVQGTASPDRLLMIAQELALDLPRGSHVVVVRRADPELNPLALLSIRSSLARMLSCTHSTIYDGCAVLLLQEMNERKLRERLDDALSGNRFAAGISTRIESVTELGRAYREALFACDEASESEVVIGYPDVWAKDLFSGALDSYGLSGPGTKLVAAIKAHDAKGGSEYLATLRTYLENLGDREMTAYLMHVHANTISYRLRQAEKFFGLDLSDKVQLRNLALGLMIHDARD